VQWGLSMSAAQVKPSRDFGCTDPHTRRLEDFNAVLAVVGRPAVEDLVTFKVRPLDADGPGQQIIMWDDEYALVRAAAGIGPETAKSPWRPFYLVDDEDVLVVYAEHETGLEIVVAGAAIVQAATSAAPYISRFLARIRAVMLDAARRHPERSRRTRLSVEVHVDDRGFPAATVNVEGDFDEVATAAMVNSAGRAAAEALKS
jgi:hypothetical protein